MTWRVELGDCIERMRLMPDESIEAVVTDPPYGLGFMGHEWDQFTTEDGSTEPSPTDGPVAALEHQMARSARRGTQRDPATGAGHQRDRDRAKLLGVNSPGGGGAMHAGRYDLGPTANKRFQAWSEAWAAEALRVLKPGGHLISFSSTRTYHRMVSGIEDAGFEIRDQIAWIFGSGFPKSKNLDGDWEGWGTALKPGHEPIVLARKPLSGTVAATMLEHGTGALNIDGCRIEGEAWAFTHSEKTSRSAGIMGNASNARQGVAESHPAGRWPSNVVLDEDAGVLLDQQTGELTSGANPTSRGSDKFRNAYGDFEGQRECVSARGADSGGASRFFYSAKASRTERDAGMAAMPLQPKPKWSKGEENAGSFQSPGTTTEARNVHPTVKPIALMRWLVRLVTAAGGVVLDPFLGSGTTGVAAVLEGFEFVGLERDAAYSSIAQARIAWWAAHPRAADDLAGELDRESKASEHASAYASSLFGEA